jgi:hypothetical protein
LTIHADRGSSMTSKPVALLFTDLGVLKTHSRPHVSNDNPYSESQFRTLKYRPSFPARFGSIQDARAFCRDFFPWYNGEHRHSGLGLCTPESVHYGRAQSIRDVRATVLTAAYILHPERFVRHHPQPPPLPIAAWINPPPAKLAQDPPARQTRAAVPGRIQGMIATPVDYLRRESSTPQKPKRRKRPNGSPLCGPTRAARTKARPRTHPRASENELLRRGQPGQGERFRSVGARRRAARRRLRPVSSS